MPSTLLQIVANFETTISAKLTTVGTSITLTSNLDKDGNAILSGTYGFTLDEGKANEEHIIGTVSGSTVTITTRNVSRQNGTTAGTGKTHRKGASIKITNHPLLVRMRRVLDGTDSFDAAAPLTYSSAPTFTPGSNQLVTVKYADDLVAGGVADATTTTKGKSKMSVAPVSPTEPIAVGDNDTRLPTQDENNALLGTSGTPSTSNKFVTADDAAENTASKIVRRKSDSNITVPATPTASTDASSKGYIDAQIAAVPTGVIYLPALAMGISGSASKVKDSSAGVVDVIRLPDGATSSAYAQIRVPTGKTSISSIKFLYVSSVGGSDFDFNGTLIYKFPINGNAFVVDNDAANEVVANGASSDRLYEYTIPVARYSSITSVAAGDVIVVKISRLGGDALDTNGGSFEIFGALFTFV